MTDDLCIIIASQSLVSLGNQGSLSVYKCEEGEIAILDFSFKPHATERNLLRLNH